MKKNFGMIAATLASVTMVSAAIAATHPLNVPFTTFATGASRNNVMQNATLTISRACAPGHDWIVSSTAKASIRGSYWSGTVVAYCTV